VTPALNQDMVDGMDDMAALPHARSTDPSSSHEAASGVKGATAHLALIVLNCLKECGPQTTHEIAERTGLTVVTVSPRIKPLRIAGHVRDSGLRRDKRSVWEAV